MAVSVDTDFDVPQLIVEVQNRPPLYDTSILEYHDRNLKKRLWREICRELYSGTVWDGLKPNEQSKIGKLLIENTIVQETASYTVYQCMNDIHELKSGPNKHTYRSH